MKDGTRVPDPLVPGRPTLSTVVAPPGWTRVRKVVGVALALGLIALAVTVLREVTREITWAEVQTAVGRVPAGPVVASMVLAAMAMLTMGLYDVLSCRIAGIRAVPAHIAGIAGFCGYALSNALGFHILLGGSVRYRIYASNGLSAREIAQILTLSLGTIWLAVGALFGVVFLLEPLAVPMFGSRLPILTQLLGAGLLAVLVVLVIWLWPGRSGLRLFGWIFPVPDGRGAILQILLGLSDFAQAAAALYVLLPDDVRIGFLGFSLIFMSSFIAGSLSHSPGGLGVFEAGILLGLGAANRPDVIAAILVFRLTYYIIPFLVAVAALFLMETSRGLRGWTWAWVRFPLLLTLASGIVAVLVFLIADLR